MYEDFDELDEELEELEDTQEQEEQDRLEEEWEAEEAEEQAAKEKEEGMEKAEDEERDELDSRQKSGVSFGSASDDARFYKEQVRRELNKSDPSEYWLRKDIAAAKEAEEQAEKEKK